MTQLALHPGRTELDGGGARSGGSTTLWGVPWRANRTAKWALYLVVCVTALVAGCGSGTPNATAPPGPFPASDLPPEPSDYWPTGGWRTSPPEEQGVDSELLLQMLDTILERGHNIDSLSVVRNGYLLADVSFYPFNQDGNEVHIVHSCTKSITSALIGIAIAQGHIEGVDQPVLDFFPDRTVANVDADKKSMTLAHVLTMSSGLRCRDSYLYDWRGLNEMRASGDWVQHMLDLPMAEPPGTRFEYCNGGSYLLAAILQETTGETALDFARQHLFGPLGITQVEWPSSPQGVNVGWGEMRLRPHDMAKIGYLYLSGGRWDGQQVVPADWVAASTTRRVAAGTLSDGYGYQWWVDAAGYYMALGYAGQFIFVLPERNMVVVFTSGLSPQDFYIPETLLNDYIIPAARSAGPLPENPDGVARLEARIKDAATARPESALPLPEMARRVSDRAYVFEDNALDFKRFSLAFEEGEAWFKLSFRDKQIEVRVGLDGVFRRTQSAGYLRAYKGAWTTDDTFFMFYKIVGYAENGSLEMDFDGDMATVRFHEVTTGRSATMVARSQH